MLPIFDKPEWTLIPYSGGEKSFFGMRNTLEVINEKGEVFVLYITIPFPLFNILKRVYKVSSFSNVELSLQESNNHWLFVIDIESEEQSLFFWYYTKSTFPEWIKKELEQRKWI